MLLSVAILCLQNSASVETRIETLLSQMTVQEEVELVSGRDNFYTRAIPRLGIPSIKMSDGPAGVRTFGKTTAYPAPICLAATWDLDLLRQVGQAYGRDARARGVDFLLAPGVNIYRTPMNGRNFEYYGEDPYLSGEIATQFILGVQSQGVAATVKHFVANNQEFDRTGTSSDVDERTLREIYLPAFEAAVKKGHVWCVMDSYNLLNGTYTSENDWLLNQLLKKEWGFRGLVMSDWGATHSTANAANHGLDLEMPGGEFFTQRKLLPEVQLGHVSKATLDDKVRRILRVGISIGAFDRTPPTKKVQDDPQDGAVALRAAREGFVLLKNKGGLLPLSEVTRIAVIGPNADPAVVGGGGSSQATPFQSVSFLDAIRARAGSRVGVEYVSGAPLSVRQIARTSHFDSTLKAEIFTNKELAGDPRMVRQDEQIDNVWTAGPAKDIGRENFSIRWTGTITPTNSGDYEFVARGDDGYRVFLDDQPIIDMWHDQRATESRKSVALEKGKTYALRVEYYQGVGEAEMRFGWRMTDRNPFAKAVEAAKRADVAMVCIGLNPGIEHEGDDHPFHIPAGQDEMVQAVFKANPKTIVILNSGCALDLTKWIDRVPALVMSWYPGQNGNTALAGILFGDASPSGKLPISFARRWEDCESFGHYPGQDHHVKYAEGIFVGYRHFDRSKTPPLFPFGFGLSYSTFKYGDMKVERRSLGNATVHFSVQNSGKMAADEVAEVFVAPKHPSVPRPVQELKGFARVSLRPGEKRSIIVSLDPRAFSYYDVKGHRWRLDPGEYEIRVGSSSRDQRLRALVSWGKIRRP